MRVILCAGFACFIPVPKLAHLPLPSQLAQSHSGACPASHVSAAFECCSCCPKTNCPCCFKVLTRTEGLKCETCGDTYCPGDIKNFSDVGVTCMFCLEEIERHLMFDA